LGREKIACKKSVEKENILGGVGMRRTGSGQGSGKRNAVHTLLDEEFFIAASA
jgi:hypothetical protein